jgi:hypothetical protein
MVAASRDGEQEEKAGGRRYGALSARTLHDAKSAFGSRGALRGDGGEDRGDRT